VGEAALIERYNADLANDLGNLLARARALLCRHLDGVLPGAYPAASDQAIVQVAQGLPGRVRSLVHSLKFHTALEETLQFVRLLNRYFNDEQPWVLARDPNRRERLGTVLYHVVEGLRIVSVLLEPAMPQKARQLRADLGLGDYSFEEAGTWGLAPEGARIPAEAALLFPRIERAAPGEVSAVSGRDEEKEGEGESAQRQEISIEDFARVELRVAEVIVAEKVPRADKLLKLTLKVGEEERTVVSGIAAWYKPEELQGKKLVLVANLKPVKIRGILSQGMILAASHEQGGLALVVLDRDLPCGSQVK